MKKRFDFQHGGIYHVPDAIIGKEEEMREIEKGLDKRIWFHEGRERWGVKGCGLINCQSRTETISLTAQISRRK